MDATVVKSKGPFAILLIDDDPDVSDILKRASRKTFPEAEFTSCQTPQEAMLYLETADAGLPKLILLDIDLGPGVVDGLTFLLSLRQHPKGQQTPTVILSSLADDQRVRQAYETGATSFLEKPLSYGGWKGHVSALRKYWSEVVKIPSDAPDGSRTPSPFQGLA